MINKKPKKLTLMFFFASDNILSPSMLTQIKAIKAAGYQKDTNVLLHFDPNEKGAPTRIFEVNRADNEKSPSRIGDCNGPLVSVLTHDDITPAKDAKREEIDAVEARDALENFLTFCRERYPAEHYMLFLIGHGMVVGRDAFLPDDNPISAIGLKQLGTILKNFSGEIEKEKGVLQLVGMHSCSMSGVEVAYELQNTARYMIASQGISFIGAWPYRQLLMTIYNKIEAEPEFGKDQSDVFNLVEQIHDLCIQNSADFMVGGYSADLCLCSLKSTNVTNLDEPIRSLGVALKKGLEEARCRDLILLAHWKSQSYWEETYTDLYDFCLCLRRLCTKRDAARPSLQDVSQRPLRRYDQRQQAIEEACTRVITALEPSRSGVGGPIIRSDFIGAGSQYAHGLSIYFPWSEPIQDKSERALTNYNHYEFNSAIAAWLDFLKAYFTKTQRKDRFSEDREYDDVDLRDLSQPGFERALKEAREAFRIPGMSGPQSVPSMALDQKVNPPDAGGGGCICPSIKNYSKDFLMSPGASAVFVDRQPNPGSNEKAA